MIKNKNEYKKNLVSKLIPLAEKIGYTNIRQVDIKKHTGKSYATLYSHFGGLNKIKTYILKIAISQENPVILAQGLCARHSLARSAPIEQKKQAAEYLIS